MRSIDRKLNMGKANLLSEQRYLQTKVINEDLDLNRGDDIVWIGGTEQINPNLTVTSGDRGTYVGRESSGEEVVDFGSSRFLTSRGKFESVRNISNNKSLNQTSDLINHVKSQGGLQ